MRLGFEEEPGIWKQSQYQWGLVLPCTLSFSQAYQGRVLWIQRIRQLIAPHWSIVTVSIAPIELSQYILAKLVETRNIEWLPTISPYNLAIKPQIVGDRGHRSHWWVDKIAPVSSPPTRISHQVWSPWEGNNRNTFSLVSLFRFVQFPHTSDGVPLCSSEGSAWRLSSIRSYPRWPSGSWPTSERRRSKNNVLSSEERFLRICTDRLFGPEPYGHWLGFDGKTSLNKSYVSQ